MSFARGIPREYIANKKFDKSKLLHLTLKNDIFARVKNNVSRENSFYRYYVNP